MITHARVRGYRCLRHIRVDLDPFTLIVGANAAGKSSLLDALAMLARARAGDDAAHIFGRGPDDRVIWMADAKSVGFKRSVQMSAGTSADAVTLEWREEDGRVSGGWLVSRQSGDADAELEKSARPTVFDNLGLGRVLRARFDPAILVRPALLSRDYREIAPDGEGFGAVLQDIQLASDGRLESVAAALQAVVPSTFGVRTKRVQVKHEGGRTEAAAQVEVRVGSPEGGWCPAPHLSEGTLFALALLTTLHSENRPSLLLFDDLDRGLHPRGQRDLVARLVALIAEIGGLQAICTTHSPYLVDEVPAERVRVFKLDAAGHTHVKSLSAHPDWPRAQGQLSSGEFWSSVGEDWVVGEG